jgi:glucose-1-phosphate adenylyltransferase
LTFVLAGGRGERLYPLTRDRAKPAVPFAGHYRIVDFTLSNCMHSGLRRVFVLVQYKSLSLGEHIREGWDILPSVLGESVETVAPQQRIYTDWYLGTADAIHQNWYCVERYTSAQGLPSAILVLAGDHVYKMDYRPMLSFHQTKSADVTVAALRVSREETRAKLGTLVTDVDHRVIAFEEKPLEPVEVPDAPGSCLASMGIYAFRPSTLREALCEDAGNSESRHDFGRDLLPALVKTGRVYAFPFELGNRNPTVYWRDVGTLDAYFAAHMDLVGASPRLDIHDRTWPILTVRKPWVPSRIACVEPASQVTIVDSLLSSGCSVCGGTVIRSVLSPGVYVGDGTTVEDSILLDQVIIGSHARVRRAIIDKGVCIPERAMIGYDPGEDSRRYVVTEGGITVIPKVEFAAEGEKCPS